MTDPTGLTYLRARYYASDTGRFISRDTWGGNYNRPLSLNRWNYTNSNPINYRDPFGLWRIAPGFELSNGGLYGQGQLTLPTSTLCTTACYTERGSKESVPIFVPQKKNGILYNGIILQLPRCDAWELAIPTNTNDWKVVFRTNGKSWAFSQGAGTSWTVGLASGMGLDSGFVPIDVQYAKEGNRIQTDPSSYYSVNDSVAFRLFMAQSQAERDSFNLVKDDCGWFYTRVACTLTIETKPTLPPSKLERVTSTLLNNPAPRAFFPRYSAAHSD